MGNLRKVSLRSAPSITTGIPFKKVIKFKKEFMLTLPTNSLSNNYIYTICAQNPNRGGIHYYNGSSATLLGFDVASCAGLAQWFNFYEDAFVRGCKVVAQIANNSAGTAIKCDYGPTIGYTLGVGQSISPFDTSNVQPSELPMFKRCIIGGSNSTQTKVIKFYMNIRKLLGIKDMEDIYNPGESSVVSSTNDPKVPNFESATDTYGQSLAESSVFGNIVLTDLAGFSDPPPANPVGPPHSIRLIVTYWVQFRNRRVLAG